MSPDSIYLIVTVVSSSLIIGLILWLHAHPKATVAEVDAEVSRRELDLQHNLAVIAELRAAYQAAGTLQQAALSTVNNVLAIIAPLTPIQADDAAHALLSAIVAPETPPEAPTPQG